MEQYITICVKPKAAALLLISGDLDINDVSLGVCAGKVLEQLMKLSVDELLEIVDNHTICSSVPVGECPQFGKLEILIEVPKIILKHGTCTYAQLGSFLKGHDNDSYDANRKFGEYYGRTATLLGLVSPENDNQDCGFTSSSLTKPFCSYDSDTQKQLVQRLSFRLNCIKVLLRDASYQETNGYKAIIDGTIATKRKKKEGIGHLLQYMREIEDVKLNKRIANIYWEEPK